jgi:hypothetical protein
VSKTCRVIFALLLVAGCGAPKPRPGPEHIPSEAAVPAQPPTGAGVYRIDAAQSEVRLLVYRAGALANLGHNHVIVNRSVTGWVKFIDDVGAAGGAASGNAPAAGGAVSGNAAAVNVAASFALSLPVADFVIDDAQARSEEGADFSEAVPEEARSGTRHNMLSPALLDGDEFPTIALSSVAATRTGGALRATLTVRIAGHESTLEVPFASEVSKDRVSASGTVTLRQTALGLVPYSVMLGALQVQDEFTVKFKVVAFAT